MEKTQFKFPEKKVILKPITRKGGWLPQNHDGNFMLTGTNFSLPVPEDPHGNLVLDATQEEIAALEKAMAVPEGYLSPNKPNKDNFWRDFKNQLKLTKDSLTLYLNKPADYRMYIIARSNKDLISPDWDSRLDKATYKFAIVDADDELKAKAVQADITKDVWISYGTISSSPTKMSNALKLLQMSNNVKVPKSATEDFLKSELKKFAENEPKKFLSVTQDPDFTLKADILSAIDAKAISKDGLKYFVTGNPDAKMTFDGLVEYLKNPENQDILLELKSRI